MAKLTKRMRNIYENINKVKEYNIFEAIILLKKLSITNFIESVDVAINLNINSHRSDQNIRGTTILPHGIGRHVRIAVFAEGINAEKAIAAGAELVGIENIVNKIKSGKINFDVIIASPDTISIVDQLGPVLGPRGLMPNYKSGTITSDIPKTIQNIKAGQINYRNDRNGIIHAIIGKINFDDIKLKENLEALIIALKRIKPSSIKGIYIKNISLSTTMGGGIVIDQTSLFDSI